MPFNVAEDMDRSDKILSVLLPKQGVTALYTPIAIFFATWIFL